MDRCSMPDHAAMLYSLRHKEALRDQSFTEMGTCFQKFREMRIELSIQRKMLDQSSTLLQQLEAAYSLQGDEYVRATKTYVDLSKDYISERKKFKSYQAHTQLEAPKLNSLQTSSLGGGDASALFASNSVFYLNLLTAIAISPAPAIVKRLFGLYCNAKGLICRKEPSHTSEDLESLLDENQRDAQTW
jgi:hypothetical protein